MLDYFKEASVSKSHKNMVELTGVASTAIRMTGALATSFLGDLIRADIFPPEAASLAVISFLPNWPVSSAIMAGKHKLKFGIFSHGQTRCQHSVGGRSVVFCLWLPWGVPASPP